jgi:hypothetical protein
MTIRADPTTRLPARARRSFAILRDARAAWALTAQALRRLPVLFAATTLGWGAAHYLCLRAIERAHLRLLSGTDAPTTWDLAWLLGLALAADSGPVWLAVAILPPQHRLILAAPRPGWAAAAARSLRLAGTILAMALCGLLLDAACTLLPRVLIPAIGTTSTILTLILLFPASCAALVALLRLAFGLPAIALGLKTPLAEGWAISRFHVTRTLGVCAAAALPLAAIVAAWIVAGPAPLGWANTLLRPVLDVATVSLTASLTGLFYRAYRLPAGLRPDVRPSRNRNQRREPVFT